MRSSSSSSEPRAGPSAHGRRDNGRTAYSVRASPGRARRRRPARGVDPGASLGHRSRGQDDAAQDARRHGPRFSPPGQRRPCPPRPSPSDPQRLGPRRSNDGPPRRPALRRPDPARLRADRKLTKWVAPAVGLSSTKLVVELRPPDDIGAWHLSVLGADPDGHLVPVEVTIVDHPKLVEQLERIERLLPALKRPGAAGAVRSSSARTRRGS